LASRRSNVFGVLIASQLAGILLLTALALALAETVPPPGHLLLAGLSGLVGAAGLFALYRALAGGKMSIAAPLSAVMAAGVPVIAGLFLEGRPAAWQQLGFGLALAAVGLISYSGGAAAFQPGDLALPLAAGVAFGFFFILIDQASESAVLWPLAAARIASIIALIAAAGLARRPWLPTVERLPLIVLVGIMDVGGNAFFVLAGQTGRLDVAAVLASLYPASTVLLAWWILKERLNRRQALGVAAALLAIALIAKA
jgi:drug/metabolite transporter (DMT)-like permease